MINKSLILSLTIGFIFLIFQGKSQKDCEYTNLGVTSFYSTLKGQIQGDYLSVYPNGNTKASGKFVSGYRTGKWTVWDTTGSIRMIRNYTSPFEFTREFPAITNEGPIAILSQPIYHIEYNQEGYIPYFPLEERTVKWSKRIWRTIDNSKNPLLFEGNYFFQVLQKLALDSSITLYHPNSDEFLEILNYSAINFNKITPVGYRIKEEWFFETDRFVMECRIIGICPVTEINGKLKDLFWVYMPETRPYFAKESIKLEYSESVKTLDDLFFFRTFSSTITKESNSQDKSISDYCEGVEMKKEAERIEISIIEKEHDIWLGLTKKSTKNVLQQQPKGK